MSYVALARDLPQELQLPMLNLVEAVRKDLHRELAVRRRDFNELAAVVRELAEAQRRTEQRVDRLEVAVQELIEAQRRTEQRLEELAEAQRRTEQRVEELAEAQRRTEEVVRQLVEFQIRAEKRLDRLETRMDAMWGEQLERRYRERAYAYFGQILRGAQAVAVSDLVAELEQHLSPEALESLLLLDVLVRGRAGRQPDAPEVWLALEVSAVVDRHDVERAQQRAALLRQAGYRVIPAVAGEEVTEGGQAAAREGAVLLVQDGRRQFWEEALAQVLASP